MRAFGCDVGNGFAYVSILNEGTGQPECTLPPQWASGAGMPAEAYVGEDGTIDVGALGAVAHTNPQRIIRSVKRHLAEGRIALGATESVDATDVYSAIAGKALSSSIETMVARGQAPTNNVVLTYPAAFANSRLLISTMSAAVEGLQAPDGNPYRVVGSIPEPAAIALDYLHFMRHEVTPRRRIADRDVTVVVYDLGQGTFDTALVTARAVLPGSEEQPWDLHDYDGLADVGGADFDQVLVDLFRTRFVSPTGTWETDALLEAQLRESAIRCKHDLSDLDVADVGFFLSDGTPVRFEVMREEFEAAAKPLLDRTMDTLAGMFESARRLGIPVTHVVLSGGASRMPMVRRAVEAFVDENVTARLFRPSAAVSFGAARFADSLVEQPEHTVRLDFSDTVDARVDRLFAPVLPELGKRKPRMLIQHVPHPLGVLYAGRRGRVMQTLLPKGATTSSKPGQLQLRADDTRVELVVARAIDPDEPSRRLGEQRFREVCHLTCDGAVPDTIYDLRLTLEHDGTISGSLVDESGHALRLEMS